MLCFSWREKAQVRAAPSPLHRGDACCSPHLLSSSAPRAVRLYQGHLGPVLLQHQLSGRCLCMSDP